MNRNRIRIALWLMLLVSSVFAGWVWFWPYDWQPDSRARGRIAGVSLSRDHRNFWCDVRVRFAEDQPHDLLAPVWLQTGEGKRLEPADTTLTEPTKQGQTIIFRFWLEPDELRSELTLYLNHGYLRVKSRRGAVALADGNSRYFTHHAW